MVRFRAQRRVSRDMRMLIVSAVIFAVILAVFFLSLNCISAGAERRQLENLEKAVDRCITYCYAVEGAYPENLDSMKKNYGLSYDERRFFVDYRYLGGNVRPDITIIDKEDWK